MASDGPYVVALDPALTPALRREGLARELVSRVQRLRKDAGFEVTTRIALSLEGDSDLLNAAREHEAWIAGETLARDFLVGERLEPFDRLEPVRIDAHAGTLAVRRLGEGRTFSGPAHSDPS